MANNNLGNLNNFGNLGVQNGIQNQKEKMVETDTLLVKGHLLRWKDVAIQISNISDITVSAAPPVRGEREMYALYTMLGCFALGFLLLLSAFTNEGAMPFALILFVAGLVALIMSAPKSPGRRVLNIYLTSGVRYSILFESESFLNDVFDVFSKIFEDGQGSVYIDQRNQKLTEINETNYGTIIKAGGSVEINGGMTYKIR